MFKLRDSQVATLRKKAIGDAIIRRFEGSEQVAARHPETGDVLVQDPKGNTIRLAFDELGFIGAIASPLERVWKLQNDSEGRLLRLTNPAGLSLGFTYDEQGNARTVTRDSREILSFDYDAEGDITRVTHLDRTNVLLTYHSRSKPDEHTDRLGRKGQYEYDSDDRLTAISDGNGNRTEFQYSDWDHPDSVLYPDGKTEFYEYSPDGFVEQIVIAGGIGVEIENDDRGRPTQISYHDGELISFVYDDSSKVVEARNDDLSVKYQYDDKGRVVQEDQDGQVVKYKYDECGNLVGLTYPSGNTVEFAYDADLRLGSVKDWNGSAHEFAYRREDNGFLHHLPNGLTSLNTLTSAGLLASTVVSGDGSFTSKLFSFDYQYNPEDRLQLFSDSDFRARTFVYDAEGQLVAVQASDRSKTESFSYDAAGNRIATNGAAGTFNSLNQLVQQGDTLCSYDAVGNMVSLSRPEGDWQFTYNDRNLMVRAEGPNEKTVTFAYDAFGRRIFKRSGKKEIRYIWAGEQLVSEIEKGESRAHIRDYLYVPGTYTPLAMRNDGQVYCYHTDHLGTPRRITDAAGSVVWSAEYAAFGEAFAAASKVSNPLRLPGQYYDEETGLHYNRFRYYSPLFGRYLSRDPITFAAGLNFYVYCGNNPTNASDPLGLNWWKTAMSFVAAGAAGVALVALAPVGVSLPLVVGAGAVAGMLVAGLTEVLNGNLCTSCMVKEVPRGVLVGAVASLAVVLSPGMLGIAGYATITAVSTALRPLLAVSIADQSNALKGIFGEYCADHYMARLGFKKLNPPRTHIGDRPKGPGIDGVYENSNPPPLYVVADAKYGSSQLGTTKSSGKQMSPKWCEDRLDKAVGVQKANDIVVNGYERWILRVDMYGTVTQQTL